MRSMLCLFISGLLFSSLSAVAAAPKPADDARGVLQAIDPAAVRAAVEEAARVFPNRYDAARHRAVVERLEKERGRLLDKLGGDPAGAAVAEARRLAADVRAALLADPRVSGQPILFVVRPQYLKDHHNTETMFQTGEINTKSYRPGGPLKVIDLAAGGAVRTIVDPGPTGAIRDPDVHFDGDRIVFSMRKGVEDDYHLYEVRADGTGLRPLTTAPGVFDIDPLYLPDGGIAFTSSREPKYCMCNRHIMGNLFRMDGDGANIHQIGKSTLFEGHGALLDDGRILYDRWEYVDRNFGDAQGLWVVNPDGTGHAIFWGNHTGSPGAVLDGRGIPGTPMIVSTFSSCHDRPWGAMAIVDPRLGLDGRKPVVRIWPDSAMKLVNEKGDFDAFRSVKTKYEDPYPLNATQFLCARQTGRDEEMGIYLVDLHGNETLVHVEGPGCYDPMPLAPRARPPAMPVRRDYEGREGYFFVQDVYRGIPMTNVKRGDAKFLRVVESGEKRSWTHPSWPGQGQEAPAMNWHDFSNKKILGTVPVEADGSVYVAVPSDTFLFFQLLDADGRMIQSMRSGTIVQSGERQGCVGCHEYGGTSPLTSAPKLPAALKAEPRRMAGWNGESRWFNFRTEVQPVFDRACVRCHDRGQPGGEKLILSGDRGLVFNQSYAELWSKKMLGAVGAGPAAIQPAYSWGSHASRLVEVLRKGHKDVKLEPGEMDRIVTWVDLNAPYYPLYTCAYPDNPFGRSPLTGPEVRILGDLAGLKLSDSHNAWQVSFDRPEASALLGKLGGEGDPRRAQALELIRAGQARLKVAPEADDPAFVMSEWDRRREDKYEARRREELRSREALREGRKVYDPGVGPAVTSVAIPSP